MNIERRTLTLTEAAIVLGVSRAQVYAAVREKRFPVPTIDNGRRIMVPDAENSSTVTPAANDLQTDEQKRVMVVKERVPCPDCPTRLVCVGEGYCPATVGLYNEARRVLEAVRERVRS